MELNQLHQFKIIAETESLTKASKILHVSQPALSSMLQKLEQEFGVKLFDRNNNRIYINEYGKLALEHTNDILDRIDQMTKDIAQRSTKKSKLSIAFCDSGPLWYCVPKFTAIHPEIIIEPQIYDDTLQGMELLLNAKVDILVAAESTTRKDLHSTLFLRDTNLLSVPSSSPLAQYKEILIRENLPSALLIFDNKGCFIRKQQPLWNEIANKTQITFYTDYLLYNQQVKESEVFTISSKLANEYRDDGDNRVLIPLADNELQIEYYLIYPKLVSAESETFLSWANSIIT